MGNSVILSKIIEVNLNFSVIHEHSLGWENGNQFMTPSFPYGANAVEPPAPVGAPSPTNTAATQNDEADAEELTGRDKRKARRDERQQERQAANEERQVDRAFERFMRAIEPGR